MGQRDWRNKADYDFTKDLDLNGWAWEFLRRNPEYRKDWEKELPIYLRRESDFRKNPQFKDSPVWGKPIISIDDPRFVVNPHKPEYLYKWGTYCLFNPDQDKPFNIVFYPTWGQIYFGERDDWLSGRAKEQSIAIPEGKVAVVFDLEKPIKPQTEKVKKNLIELQNYYKAKGLKINVTKKHQDKWPNYLRISDANDEGAHSNEIAKIIFPELSNNYPDYEGNRFVKDSLNAAKRLIYGGYCAIV